MKVFWSWQSDTPGKIGRHFVRDALLSAIELLKQPPELEEPTERETREALHLDQDRAGVPGSPDLARVILEKIARSAVFVADVTPVGATSDGEKKLINSNVAIELGYALHVLTDSALLMVLNEYYGTHEELPFDLRHKAGPVTFRLSPEAKSKEIDAAKKMLVGHLKEALALCLAGATAKPAASPAGLTFLETRPKESIAAYFKAHEILGKVGDREDGDEVEYRFDTVNGISLRLIPTQPQLRPLPLSFLLDKVMASPTLQPLHQFRSKSFRQTNPYGVIAFEPSRPNVLKAATQLFQNGEIWGFNAHATSLRDDEGRTLLSSAAIEGAYRASLPGYVAFARDAIGIPLPYTVEFAVAGMQDAYILLPDNERRGPIHVPSIAHRMVLNDIDPAVLDRAMLTFFEMLYDVSDYARPTGLYGFPPR